MASEISAALTEEWLETAVDLARKASKIVRQGLEAMKNVVSNYDAIETKTSPIDLVTEFDKKVEQFLFSALKEKYPDHKFIGEESAVDGSSIELTDTPTWVIDPIDGTMNFVHRFPMSAICIGVMVRKQVEVGVVYHVSKDDMYAARRGFGAYCNKDKLEVSHQEDLGRALICSEFSGRRPPELHSIVIENLKKVQAAAHGIRMLGSAALNMCMIATGGIDGYYEFGIHVWDMAASSIILTEAGGFLMDPEGGPVDLMSRKLVCASSKALAEALCNLLTPIMVERDGP